MANNSVDSGLSSDLSHRSRLQNHHQHNTIDENKDQTVIVTDNYSFKEQQQSPSIDSVQIACDPIIFAQEPYYGHSAHLQNSSYHRSNPHFNKTSILSDFDKFIDRQQVKTSVGEQEEASEKPVVSPNMYNWCGTHYDNRSYRQPNPRVFLNQAPNPPHNLSGIYNNYQFRRPQAPMINQISAPGAPRYSQGTVQNEQELIGSLIRALSNQNKMRPPDISRRIPAQCWSDSELAAYEALSLNAPATVDLHSGSGRSDVSAVARAAFEAAKTMAALQNANLVRNMSQPTSRSNIALPTGKVDDELYINPELAKYITARSRQTVPPLSSSGFNSAPAQLASSYWSGIRCPGMTEDYMSYDTMNVPLGYGHFNQGLPVGPSGFLSPQKPSYINRQHGMMPINFQQEFRLVPTEKVMSVPKTAGFGPPVNPGNPLSSIIAFTNYKQSPGLSGMVVIHLISGTNLNSNQMMLRDLYCVVETDSTRKARSMIRTSTNYFEWDEVFEIDIEDIRSLSILLYQWDPKTRHRLCFYGAIDLVNIFALDSNNPNSSAQTRMKPQTERTFLTSSFVQRSNNMLFEKVALQLEPRGILYFELGFMSIQTVFSRRLSLSISAQSHAQIGNTSILFGVSIDELIYRERRINRLIRQPSSQSFDPLQAAVPFIIRKCANEVDRRGLKVVGIYRLSGSVWMKLQIKELFERVSTTIYNGLANEDSNIVANVLSLLDLSPERVPDIHAITAIMKDFLRELPEPLFSNALYPMLHDTIQVTLPGDVQSGAKLMLNILDCLPSSNQEILLFLLDHFKRVIKNSDVNKMDAYNLAMSVGPILLYPSPEAAKLMDPAMLEPRRMTEIFRYILEIWPDARTSNHFPKSDIGRTSRLSESEQVPSRGPGVNYQQRMRYLSEEGNTGTSGLPQRRGMHSAQRQGMRMPPPLVRRSSVDFSEGPDGSQMYSGRKIGAMNGAGAKVGYSRVLSQDRRHLAAPRQLSDPTHHVDRAHINSNR